MGRRRTEQDPFREMMGLRDTISGLFDDFFNGRSLLSGVPGMQTYARGEGWMPPISIRETDQEIVFYACLPGVSKQDCSVEVKDNTLVLSGTCPDLGPDDGNWLRSELPSGHFYRAFTLPTGVDADRVKASCRDGILEVHLAKSEEAKPRKVDIQ